MSAAFEWGCVSKALFASRYDAARTLIWRDRRVQRHQSRGKSEPHLCAVCGACHVGIGK